MTIKISAIEPELIEAQKNYDDVFNRIGADWTISQHKEIDTIPTKKYLKQPLQTIYHGK